MRLTLAPPFAPTFTPDAPGPLEVFIGGKPEGISLILLRGRPGSGVRTVGRKLRERMEARGIAVEHVDDRTFHRLVPACGICEANGLRQLADATYCVDCADSLDVWSLYPAIHDAVRNLTNSKLYTDSGSTGLIIVQWRHVLTGRSLARKRAIYYLAGPVRHRYLLDSLLGQQEYVGFVPTRQR